MTRQSLDHVLGERRGDMNQGNDEKAKDQAEIVVTLANDWFRKELVLKFPNRNVPGC